MTPTPNSDAYSQQIPRNSHVMSDVLINAALQITIVLTDSRDRLFSQWKRGILQYI